MVEFADCDGVVGRVLGAGGSVEGEGLASTRMSTWHARVRALRCSRGIRCCRALIRYSALVLLSAASLLWAAGRSRDRSYCAAFYSSGSAFMDEQRLIVFPDDQAAVEIPLPFALGRFAWGPDARSLYATIMWRPEDDHEPEGLYRIQFGPVRLSAIPIPGMGTCHSIAVSPLDGRLFVSGEYKMGRPDGVVFSKSAQPLARRGRSLTMAIRAVGTYHPG